MRNINNLVSSESVLVKRCLQSPVSSGKWWATTRHVLCSAISSLIRRRNLYFVSCLQSLIGSTRQRKTWANSSLKFALLQMPSATHYAILFVQRLLREIFAALFQLSCYVHTYFVPSLLHVLVILHVTVLFAEHQTDFHGEQAVNWCRDGGHVSC